MEEPADKKHVEEVPLIRAFLEHPLEMAGCLIALAIGAATPVLVLWLFQMFLVWLGNL